MRTDIESFSQEGLSIFYRSLREIHPWLHPIYISSLIQELGKNRWLLPTRDNELTLLQMIREQEYIPPETALRIHKILGATRKRRIRETALFFVSGQEPDQNYPDPDYFTPRIHVFADNRFICQIEKARQGFMLAIQDIEMHTPGRNSNRVHEEEQGRVLCQADTSKNQWGCADRFVYGTDSPAMSRALGIGHVKDHQRKGAQEYKTQKDVAKKITNKDFCDKIPLSSRGLKQTQKESKTTADEMLSPSQKPLRLTQLQQDYRDYVESFGNEGKELFKEILLESIKTQGHFTKSEKKTLSSLPKGEPFRMDIEQAMAEINKNLTNKNTPLPSPNKGPIPPGISLNNERE